MKRWHLTVVLGLLAAAGVALAGTVPVVTVAALVIGHETEPVVPELPDVEPARPVHTRPVQSERPQALIPEIDEPLPPVPVVLPPDPPDMDPCPACGMG